MEQKRTRRVLCCFWAQKSASANAPRGQDPQACWRELDRASRQQCRHRRRGQTAVEFAVVLAVYFLTRSSVNRGHCSSSTSQDSRLTFPPAAAQCTGSWRAERDRRETNTRMTDEVTRGERRGWLTQASAAPRCGGAFNRTRHSRLHKLVQKNFLREKKEGQIGLSNVVEGATTPFQETRRAATWLRFRPPSPS